MSDATELFLIVLAVYFVECLVPLRVDGLAFLAWWPGRYLASAPFSLRGSRTLAVTLSPPWPPLIPALVAEPWPLELDPDGLTDGATRLAWSALASVHVDGRTIVITASSGRLTAHAGSASEADAFGALVESVRGAGNKREKVLTAAVAARFDLDRARRALEATRNRARICRISGSVALLSLAVGAPLAVYGDGLVSGWGVVGVGVAAWWTAAGVTIFSARALGLTLTQRIGLFLSPLSAIRAGDHFFRAATRGLEPVAAALLVRSPDLHDVARRALSDWTLRTGAAGRWLPARLADAARRGLVAEGTDVDSLFAPPDPEGDAVVAYCPRCLSQFVTEVTVCPSCGDVPTKGVRG